MAINYSYFAMAMSFDVKKEKNRKKPTTEHAKKHVKIQNGYGTTIPNDMNSNTMVESFKDAMIDASAPPIEFSDDKPLVNGSVIVNHENVEIHPSSMTYFLIQFYSVFHYMLSKYNVPPPA